MVPDQEKDRVKTCDRVRDVCVVCTEGTVAVARCVQGSADDTYMYIHTYNIIMLYVSSALQIFQKINFSFVSDNLSV